MTSDDDELQPQDDYADDTDGWNQEVRQRRERLFEEDDSDEIKPPKRSKPEEEDRDPIDAEQERQEKELRSIVDKDVIDFANETLSRRRQQNSGILPTSPPVITSDFSSFQSTPFRRDEEDKQIGRIKHSTPCPTATLVCDSVSASKSKCGYPPFIPVDPGSNPRFFLRLDDAITGSYGATLDHDHGLSSACGLTETDSYTDWVTTSKFLKETNCVSTTIDYEGTFNEVVDSHRPGSSCHFTRTVVNGGSTSESGSVCSCTSGPSDCINFSFGSYVIDDDHTRHRTGKNDALGSACISFGWSISGGVTNTQTLSDEYTTAVLKSAVISALPSYSGTFTGYCPGATYDLSSDELSFSLRRERYKILLSAPACAGMVVTWKERFVASPSGTVTNVNKSQTCTGGETEIGPITIPDPTANGTTTVTNINVDCSGCTDSAKYQDVEFDQ